MLSLAKNDGLWLISLVYHINGDASVLFVLGLVSLLVGLRVVVVVITLVCFFYITC